MIPDILIFSKQKYLDFYFNFTDPKGQKVSTILAQMKLVSVKRLIKRDIYVMPAPFFEEIREKLKSFLWKIETPHGAGFLEAFRHFVYLV